MAYRDDAARILGETENSLRHLLEEALAHNQYRAIAEIAPLADAVAALISSYTREELKPGSLQDDTTSISSTRPAIATPSRKRSSKVRPSRPTPTTTDNNDYPRFEREEDKLIKIGWSKKDGRAYEHRAPKEVVILVGKRLSEGTSPEIPFRMEEILPILDDSGSEIPSYQAYMALAWFRTLRAVERRGKNGYVVRDDSLTPTEIRKQWNLLHSRK